MRVIRLLLIATLAAGALLLVAPAAGAASKNCTALKTLDDKVQNIDTSGKNLGKFSQVADEFRTAAKQAKGKLKSSMNNLAEIYDSIGGGNLSDLSKLSGSSYSKSLKTFIKASVNCA